MGNNIENLSRLLMKNWVYIQNGSAKFAGENNMKNTAGLPNGWGAQPQRVYNVSQSSNTKKGDRSLPKIN